MVAQTTRPNPPGVRWQATLVGLLMAVSVHAGTADHNQNDAGTLADAPDLMADSVSLSGYASYQGNFTSSDGSDWYKLRDPQSGPACLALAPGGSTSAYSVNFSVVNETQANEAVVSVGPLRSYPAGVASMGLKGTVMGVKVTTLPNSLMGYSFALTRVLSNGATVDAINGGDVGSGLSTAPAFQGGCTKGRVGGTDQSDTYRFDGLAGEKIQWSMADEAGSALVSLLSPNGNVLAQSTSGQSVAYTLVTTGTYYLSVSSQLVTSYVLGHCPECEPPSNPCQPMCIDMLD